MDADPKQLRDLVQVTALAFDASLAPLAEIQREEDRLRGLLADLRARPVQGGEVTPAMLAGADLAWDAWAARRREVLNTELARLLARKMQVEARVRRAFGRKMAAEELLEQAGQRR